MSSHEFVLSGTVVVDGKPKEVKYRFINDNEIECVDVYGKTFTTHYKSLVVE